MIQKIGKRVKQELKYRVRKTIKPDVLEIHGVKLNINHPSITDNLKEFFYNESYEGQEVRVLEKVLEKSDRVFEIGAGIGFLSTYCSKKIGSDKVVAYEANPQMITKIKETYKLNGVNPIINNIILMDKDGEVDFYLEDDFWSSSMIKRSDNAKKIKVKTADINNELKKYNSNFMIIDIEGGEELLIPIINFNAIDKILIELHPNIIGNKSTSNIIKTLIEKGFCLDLFKSENNICYFYKE